MPPIAKAAVGEPRLLRAARHGDPRAREEVLVSKLNLVRSVASRYGGLGLPFDDLFQEGALGLLEAIDRYEPRRGVPFDTFARYRIRRSIRNALTEKGRLIRLPKHIVERRRALDRVEARLTAAAGGRVPTPEELAHESGLSVEAVLSARSAGIAPLSLNDPVLPDGSQLSAVVADTQAEDPALSALEHEQVEQLHAAVSALPDRQRRLVCRRWGLTGRPRTSREVAAELDLSPRRVETIGRDALYGLKAILERESPQ